MSKKVFKLSDFDSRACDIELKVGDDVRLFSLRKFTLMDRIWAENEFQSLSEWENSIFPKTKDYSEAAWTTAILKTAHNLLEKKHHEEFPTWEDFGGSLECSVEILVNLQKALLYVLHGSEPIIERLDEEVKKNLKQAQALPMTKKKTKRKSTGRK